MTGGARATEGGGRARADAVVVKTLPRPEGLARWTHCWMVRYSSRRSRHIFTRSWIGEGTPTKWCLRLMFLKFGYRLGVELGAEALAGAPERAAGTIDSMFGEHPRATR